MVRWVEVKSFTLSTDKDVYNPGETIHAQCKIVTGSGYSTSARIVLSGITTKIVTFAIYPRHEHLVSIDMSIPSYIDPGTYTLTAELDEYWESPPPIQPIKQPIQPIQPPKYIRPPTPPPIQPIKQPIRPPTSPPPMPY